MAFDGITVSNVVYELNTTIAGGRIDKIQQPEKDEIIICVRNKGENYKLLITADASHPRLHLTDSTKTNPMTPPLFCMVLRKHLSSGKVLNIIQPDFERVVIIEIEALNEMGDLGVKRLIVEIMGKHSNIILVGENGVILDSVKHISQFQSSVREVLPGREYKKTPSQNKINPLSLDYSQFLGLFENVNNHSQNPQGLIYKNYTGISPLSASEIVERSKTDPSAPVSNLTETQKQQLFDCFETLMKCVAKNEYDPVVIFDHLNKPLEFSAFALSLYSSENNRKFESISKLLDFFYMVKDNVSRISQKSQDLRKVVQLGIERCVKKSEIQQKTLEEIKERDFLRLCGELVTANIYAIKTGMDKLSTVNYYEENTPEITIRLDPNKSPPENAQHYFKKYNKQKRTFEAMKEQIEQNNEEMAYLEGVLASLISSTDEADLNEIRDELAEQGFVRRRAQQKGAPKPKKAKPLHFISADGFDIYVGKNNKQNDELTLKFAAADDLWLHTKAIPGSHVIIKTEGKAASSAAIEEAANLAAFYSKARNSSSVPVDYTQRKFVKKPNGAKPGMVIYETNKTAFITPDEGKINLMKKG